MSAIAVRLCRQCHRANPHQAVYCHHDGVRLDGHAGDRVLDAGAQPFAAPFVLTSGQVCHNFNELALAFQADPQTALELLRVGHLESFLAAHGRMDLVGAAHFAARSADKLRGLDEFLGRLPVNTLRPARLQVVPTVLDLGVMQPGEDRRCVLTLNNEGMRLLIGSASCDAGWLSLGDGAELKNKLFQLSRATVLPVRILGRHLRAMEKPQQAEINLESNGGAVTVVVRLIVPVKPFPEGVLSGALSPRQAAHKATESPKEAAILIESGALTRWYASNGWTYPVLGPTASGIAAVQQFLEALGLVKPPQVEMSEDHVELRGQPGDTVEYTLAVITHENRAAWAFATCDQPWLRFGATIFRGRSAFLPLTISGVPGKPGDTLQAVVSITANGGQRFAVPISLLVGSHTAKPRTAPTAAVPAAKPIVTPAPMTPLAPRREGRSHWFRLVPALVLLAAIGLAVLRDYLAPAHETAPPPSEEVVDSVPRLQLRYHDRKQNDELEKVWLTDPQPTMRFGVVMLHNGEPVGKGATVKRLTFDPWGRTNNTCLRFDAIADKDERLFGGPGGRWQESAAKKWKDEHNEKHAGRRSIWICDDKKIEVTQFVELVRGERSRLLDTCRVRYLIENQDTKAHQVGIRFLLDSFIGGNDGVPFTIPGDSNLCDTMKELPYEAKDKKLPDFLQALEKPDLANPGTIAHLRLKLEGLEPPERVTLGAWPNEKLRVLDRQAGGPSTLWNVPLLPLKSLELNDSAITIYWKEQALKVGAKREVGFEYGLWNLASQGSRLATTIDGSFRPNGELTVVAYVNKSAGENEDETLTLTLPEGFTLLEGTAKQSVPNLPKNARSGNLPVTWKVKAGPATGEYEFAVKSSAGPSQTLSVEIKKPIF